MLLSLEGLLLYFARFALITFSGSFAVYSTHNTAFEHSTERINKKRQNIYLKKRIFHTYTPAIVNGSGGVGAAGKFHGITSSSHVHDAGTFGIAQHPVPCPSEELPHVPVVVQILVLVIYFFEDLHVTCSISLIYLLPGKQATVLCETAVGIKAWS